MKGNERLKVAHSRRQYGRGIVTFYIDDLKDISLTKKKKPAVDPVGAENGVTRSFDDLEIRLVTLPFQQKKLYIVTEDELRAVARPGSVRR